MKIGNQNNKYRSFLIAVISLAIGFCIDFYYSSFMPDFDIGFNEAFTTLKCRLFILAIWGIELGCLRLLVKRAERQTEKSRRTRLASLAVMAGYWLIVWGFCYYQYIVKATQDWNDMMNGNAG